MAEIIDNTTSRGRTLKLLFDRTEEEFYALVNQIGHMPLPPQIGRSSEPEDRAYYQTIFAQNIGSIVLPAAGLHFTPYLLKYLALQNISVVPVTLHIGLGELSTIDMEDLTKVRASSERFTITPETATVVNHSLQHQKKFVPWGLQY